MDDKIGLLKKLREETSLGMMECKKALEEVNYNYKNALTLLREKGKYIAGSKSGRATGQGLVGFKNNDTILSIVELCCETDFVAKGDIFCDLLDEMLDIALEKAVGSAADLLALQEVSEKLTTAIAKVGENIEIKRVFCKKMAGFVSCYVHNAVVGRKNLGQIISAILFDSDRKDEVFDVMYKVAMHAAATFPRYIDKDGISKDVIDEEKRIYTEQARSSGKPDHVIEKMVDGRLNKFVQEFTLLNQSFVIDPDICVGDFLQKFNKDNNTNSRIVDMLLVKLAN